jgi:DNA-binding MarR family transcriptional regulator
VQSLLIEDAMEAAYLDVIALVERLHRQFLELMKLELDTQGIEDVNNVQALLLFNIGDLEMNIGELMLRGCYLGSNVSHYVKKLVEAGYLLQERSQRDRRFTLVRLSEKGRAVREKIAAMHERSVAALSESRLTQQDLTNTSIALRRLDRFWTVTVDLGSRATQLLSAA